MDTNLTFEFGISEIMDRIDGEISRHAAFLRFQDGGSAYDTIYVHTNDKPTVEGFVSDAFRSIVTRFEGESRYGTPEGSHRLSFYLPDFDNEIFNVAEDEIRRYVVLSTTASWLVYRSFAEYAKIVSVESEASMNRLVSLLRTRKFPIE